MRKTIRILALTAMLPLLGGCDQLMEALDIPNPKKEAAKIEAEGEAIGSACRHAGRSLEDCYTLNPDAQKAAIFAGWRSMNDYMMENKLEVVPSQLQAKQPPAPPPEPAEATTEKPPPAGKTPSGKGAAH